VNARIAAELHVTRKMVAEVLESAPRELPEAVQSALEEAYRRFVEHMQRPPEGRRRLLARTFNLSKRQVTQALAALLQTSPDYRELDRPALFQIEQAYWRHLRTRDVPLDRLAAAVATELALPLWPVARYLDWLHDDPRKVRGAPLPGAETQARILAGYERYLEGAAPAEPNLHTLLAASTGASPVQVYRVLLEHRWEERRRFSPESSPR
jgi:hypothetical protein